MKYNNIILCFIAIICFGCKSNNYSHRLICNFTKGYEDQTITINFNDNDDKVLNVKIETIIYVSDYDESRKQQLIDFIKEKCSNAEDANCYAFLKDDKIIENMEMSGSEYFEDNKKTIDELQNLYENDGFSCER